MRASEYRVLIYCPFDGGHYLNFVRLIATAFLRLGVQLRIATTEKAQRSRELSDVRVDGRPISVIRLPARRHAGRFTRARDQIEELRSLTQVCRWSRVILPAGDGLLQTITLFAQSGIPATPQGLPVEALVLRGGVAYPGSPVLQLKRRLSWSLLERAPVSVHHHLDPVFLDWVRAQPPPVSDWRLMPDPVDVPAPFERRDARTRLGIPADGIVLGCVGVIDERKGIHLVLDAFEKARLSGNVHLLLVGVCSPGVRKRLFELGTLQTFAGRLHVRDGWATDGEMTLALAAMDLVAAAYPGHVGSASIILRAMAAGRPVLGSPTPWITRHLTNYAAGWVADAEDRGSFPAALARAVEASLSWSPSPRVRELLAFNSAENFMAHWTLATVADLGCSSPFAFQEPPPDHLA